MASFIPLYGGEGPGGSLTTGQKFDIAGTSAQAFGDMLAGFETARGLKLNAKEIVREGKRQAARIRETGERVQSAQRVGFIKGGVEISGSALEVMNDTAIRAEKDALEVEAAARRQAREARRAARKAKNAGVGQVLGTIGGAVVGGPAGAAIGGQIGGAIGGSV